MNITETPHRWLVVKMTTPKLTFYKLFGTWMGGYLDGDYWQMNSGIVKVEEDNENYYFHGRSGSVYQCNKKGYGTTNYGQSTLDMFIKKAKKENTTIEVLSEDTKWMELLGLQNS